MTQLLTQETVNSFLAEHPEVETVDVLMPDTNGIFRGKRLQMSALDKLTKDGMRIPGSMYLVDVEGQNCLTIPYGSTDGDPDFAVFGVDGTLSLIPWAERPSAQIMGTMLDDDGAPYFGDPRQVLLRAMKPLTDMGLTPVIAIELEFYLLDPKMRRDGMPRPAASPDLRQRPTTTQAYNMDDLGDFDEVLTEIERSCEIQGVLADVTTSEYAPGQFEINLTHVADAAAACDQAVLFKRVVKSVARKHRMIATFMAKPFPDQAGNGMHVHVSIVDKEGRNIFSSDAVDPETGLQMDASLRHAIAGLRQTMADAMAIYAPNANSYRRFRTDSYAPVNRAWGMNNRSVALRIPHSDAAAVRVEHRAAGADANPYLVAAAVLAGVHHGISEKLDPGPMETGNAYDRPQGGLPTRWEPALATFEHSEVMKQYLGETYHETYLGIRRWEADQYHDVIPPRDYELYMRSV